eukprot:SAG31_NODE_2971_length_4839_cov_1.617722_6_plen_51_part_00
MGEIMAGKATDAQVGQLQRTAHRWQWNLSVVLSQIGGYLIRRSSQRARQQ